MSQDDIKEIPNVSTLDFEDDGFGLILNLISKLGFQYYDDALTIESACGAYQVLRGLEEFREHLGGKLTIPLLRDIGEQIEVNEMDLEILATSIDLLKSYALEHAQ